jgi:hypothetical protein
MGFFHRRRFNPAGCEMAARVGVSHATHHALYVVDKLVPASESSFLGTDGDAEPGPTSNPMHWREEPRNRVALGLAWRREGGK